MPLARCSSTESPEPVEVLVPAAAGGPPRVRPLRQEELAALRDAVVRAREGRETP